MMGTFLLIASSALGGADAAFNPLAMAAVTASAVAEDPKDELKRRQDALKPDDAEGLYQLALWAEEKKLNTDSKRILRKVIKIDTNHKGAREKLGYKLYGDPPKWRTDTDIARLEREKEDQEMRAKGLEKWQGQWVAKEVKVSLEKGLIFYGSVKTKTGEELKGTIENWTPNAPTKVIAGGNTKEIAAADIESVHAEWMTPEQRDRQERGLVLFENEWLSPEEIAKRKENLYHVDEKYVSLEEANQVHSDLAKPWVFEAEYIGLRTNCEYGVGRQVLQGNNNVAGANKTYKRTLQNLGFEVPAEAKPKISIVLVAGEEDYNSIGNNVQDDQDAQKSSSYSYFCHLDPQTGSYVGIVNYALTPDYTTYMAMQAASELALRSHEFGETVPRWFIEGVACSEARFFDPLLGKWTIDGLRNAGGLVSLNNYFDPLVVSNQGILQAGLLVTYIRSSAADAKVKEAYQEVLKAFKAPKNQGLEKAFRALEKTLQANEKKITEYMDNYK
jgi:hypothetical protein